MRPTRYSLPTMALMTEATAPAKPGKPAAAAPDAATAHHHRPIPRVIRLLQKAESSTHASVAPA